MDILFCGTAAAEAWPGLFCSCAPCQEARRLGGKNIRSRAAYMVGEKVRIDFGPDSNLHQQRFGLAYDRLEHLLVSHSHDDHWFPNDIAYREPGFSIVPDENVLQVYGSERVRDKFVRVVGRDDWARYRLAFHLAEPWQRNELCDGLAATPVVANHDRREVCLNWVLHYEGRSTLVGHDTSWYEDATWDYLSANPLSLVILDCTYGKDDYVGGHLGCPGVLRARDEMAKRGALAPDARVVATHFSHNGAWLHEDLERFFTPHGVSVAYDGFTQAL